jgi:glutathione S-transferase
MTRPYILHYAPDNASLIVRLALEEMGLPYRTALVDRSKRAQRSAAYLALNPNGLIPVLETPDGALFETGAILLWLADRHGALAPAPDDPQRGAFLTWLFWLSNTLHADLRLLFHPPIPDGSDCAARAASRDLLQAQLRSHLQLLETVAQAAPSWLSSNQPSVLSLYVACLMRWMALYPENHDRSWFRLADTPALRRMLGALETRPSVTASETAEGLGPAPFTAPCPPNPPEGSAT